MTSWTAQDSRPNPPAGLPITPWQYLVRRLGGGRATVLPSTLFFGSRKDGAVYRSQDKGVSFKEIWTSLPTRGEWELATSSIVAVPGHEGHVWITTGNGLQRSTDSAQTFAPVAGVQEAYAIGFGKPAAGAKHPAIYLLGKIGGKKAIFRSNDEAKSFSRINDDEHQYAGASHIAGDPRVAGRSYLGTGGRGILYGTPR